MNHWRSTGASYPRSVRLLAVASILLVLIATLTPGGTPSPPFPLCVICGTQGIADAICNIALFAPVGAGLVILGLRPSRAVLLAAALSVFVEGMQATVVTGRDASVGDVVFNSIGGLLGVLIIRESHRWLNPDSRDRRILAFGAVVAACATIALTGLLLQPAFQQTPWYGQWTAQFGNMEYYHGRVLAAQLGGRAIPSRRLNDGGAAREALLDGEALTVRVESSPLTRGLSAIFSVYDNGPRQQFLLGANRSALDLYVRRRADDARMVNPPLRFEGVLAGVAGGDTLVLQVHRDRARWCAGRISRGTCLGYTAGAGWELLQDTEILLRHAGLVSALWLAGLLLPAGYWLRGRYGALSSVIALGMVCAVIPVACGLVVSPPLEWLVAVGGLVAGHALGAIVRSAIPPRPRPSTTRVDGAGRARGGIT
jgi:hypothetical protein